MGSEQVCQTLLRLRKAQRALPVGVWARLIEEQLDEPASNIHRLWRIERGCNVEDY